MLCASYPTSNDAMRQNDQVKLCPAQFQPCLGGTATWSSRPEGVALRSPLVFVACLHVASATRLRCAPRQMRRWNCAGRNFTCASSTRSRPLPDTRTGPGLFGWSAAIPPRKGLFAAMALG